MSRFHDISSPVRLLKKSRGGGDVAANTSGLRHLATLGLMLAMSSLIPSVPVIAQEVIANTKWKAIVAEKPAGNGEIGTWEERSDGWFYVAQFGVNDAEQIEMLWRQFRKNFQDGGITTKYESGGMLVKSKLTVTTCPDISHAKDKLAAYKSGFFVVAAAQYAMGIKEKNGFALGSGDASTQIIDGVKTTVFFQNQDIQINWDPKTSQLSVKTIRFGSPQQTGPQYPAGVYNVTGTSTTTSLAKSTSVGLSFIEDKYSFSSSTTTVSGKNRLKVVLGGIGFRGEYGDVFLVRHPNSNGGTLELSFPAKWLTSVNSRTEEKHAIVSNAQCQSTKATSFDLNVKEFGVGLQHSSDDTCAASKTQLPVRAMWSATPLVLNGEEEGLSSRMRFNVIWTTTNGKKTAESYYDVRSTTGITLLLDAIVLGDPGGGGGISVANKSNKPQQSDQFNKSKL